MLYLTTVSADQIPHPNDRQRGAFRGASEALLKYVPVFFAPQQRPPAVSESDWKSAQAYMESAARKVLAKETH